MELAPIVLFVFNRPWHTRKTLEALSENELASESELFVFADGPRKNSNSEELSKISEVRRIVKEKQWCKEVRLIESDINKGIEESTISGITRIVNEYERVIVLEDDLITSSYFLSFMNEGLELFSQTKNIYCINGYMFPIQTNRHESVLLPFISSWGWATWKDRWAEFEYEMKQKDVISDNIFLASRFNLADYKFTDIIKFNTWDIRWYYSLFIRNGLGVFPTVSLIWNTGFDGSGVHFTEKTDTIQFIVKERINLKYENVIDLKFYESYLKYFQKKKTYFSIRVWNWIKRKVILYKNKANLFKQ